jgi:SAM-dependent methyltransferase
VFSFEVLEHLPDPRAAIRDLAAALKGGGVALITEAFGAVAACYPTHLRSSCALRGKTAFLFAAHGLALTWYSRERLFKPMEFTKRAGPSRRDLIALLRDRHVLRSYAEGRYRVLRSLVRRYVPAPLLAAPR